MSRSPSPYHSSEDDRSRLPNTIGDYKDIQNSHIGASPLTSPEITPSSPPLGPDGKPDWRSLRTSGPYANTNQSNHRSMAHHQHRVLRSASRSASRVCGVSGTGQCDDDDDDSCGSGSHRTGHGSMLGDNLDILEVDDESEYLHGRGSHHDCVNRLSSSDLSRSSSDGQISDRLSDSDGPSRSDGTDGTDDTDDDDDDLFASTLGSDFLDLFARDGLIGGDGSDSDDAPSRVHGEAKIGGGGGTCHSPIRVGSGMRVGGVGVSTGLGSVGGALGGEFSLGSASSNMSLTPRPASVGPPSGAMGLSSLTSSSSNNNRRATTAMVFD